MGRVEDEQKGSPGGNLTRGLAVGALVLALVVVGYLLLRPGGSHTYDVYFQNAGQLVNGDDVQVGGTRIGSIKSIELTNDNQARVRVTIGNAFGALHQGTTALIRQASLSGIANRYIALTAAPNSNPAIPDGGSITADKTSGAVDIDVLFDTLDPKTRAGLQQIIQGSASQYAGQEANANRAAHFFNPLLGTSDRLVSELLRDQQTFTGFLVSSSRTVTTLASRAPQISNLVSNGDTTFGAINAENVSLSQALVQLPPTLRRANTTFVNLRVTLDDLDRLVNVAKPDTRKLLPFLVALRPFIAQARPTVRDLRALAFRPGPNNDLVDLLLKTPKLERVLRPAAANTVTALRQSQPMLQFIRPYTPDLEGWIKDFGQGAASYDANGHYARIQPIVNQFSFNDNAAGGALTALSSGNQLSGFSYGNFERCPGTAIQTAVDRSNPFRDSSGSLDCNPAQGLPGPP